MLLITGTFRLPAERLAAALEAMAAMVNASRAEAGCLTYVYAEDLFDRGLIHVTEMWSDRDALDLHFASAHIAKWRAAFLELGISDRNLTLFDVDEGRAV